MVHGALLYFIFSGILQYILSFVEVDIILYSLPKEVCLQCHAMPSLHMLDTHAFPR